MKGIAAFVLMAGLSAPAFASGEAISFHKPADAPAYDRLSGKAKELAKSFFARLSKVELIGDLMRVNGEKSFSPGLLFSKLRRTPVKEIENCQAVFCRDLELQKILNDEMAKGRLVLVTNSYSGFVAAMVNDTPETVALKRVLAPEGDGKASVLIVTPKTLISSIEHERTHAADEESGVLKPLLARIRELHAAGSLTVERGRAIHQFAGEVRAYEKEMRFLVSKSRAVEYVADDGAEEKTPVIQVRTENRREFILRRLAEVDMKVRELYLPPFLEAMTDDGWKAAEKKEIAAAVKALLPASGPYSYEKLVERKLAALEERRKVEVASR